MKKPKSLKRRRLRRDDQSVHSVIHRRYRGLCYQKGLDAIRVSMWFCKRYNKLLESLWSL
jgi:hypothetical protein